MQPTLRRQLLERRVDALKAHLERLEALDRLDVSEAAVRALAETRASLKQLEQPKEKPR
jgi:hypothetical protein